MNLVKNILAAATLLLAAVTQVCAQSSQLPSGYVFGNATASQAQASPTSGSDLLDRWCSATPGSFPVRTSGSWGCQTTLPTTAFVNPTSQVGPTVVNGTALTAMRSDSAPAINLSAAYTWTGLHTFNNARVNTTLSIASGNVSGGFGAIINFDSMTDVTNIQSIHPGMVNVGLPLNLNTIAGGDVNITGTGSLLRINNNGLLVGQLTPFKYYLTAFGVVADGVTDDTAAMNTAIAYANSNGGNITFVIPNNGTVRFTKLNSVMTNSVFFVGDGVGGTSTLQYSDFPAMTWGSTSAAVNYGGLVNLSLIGPSTDGIAISLPQENWFWLTNVRLSGVDQLVSAGTSTTNTSLIIVDGLTGAVPATNNSLFDLVSGAGLYLSGSNLFVSGSAPTGRGLLTLTNKNWDTVQVYNNLFQIFDFAILANSASGVNTGNYFWSNNVADGFTKGFIFTAQSGGFVNSPTISGNGGWLTLTGPGNHNTAIVMTGAGTIQYPSIIDLRIGSTGKGAILIDAATVSGLKIDNLQLSSTNTEAGANDDVYIAGGAGYSGGSITNVKNNDTFFVTTPRYGINIDGVVDHYDVTNNDMKGGTAPYQGMAVGTTTIRSHTNFRQTGNIGLADYGLTIAVGTVINGGATGRVLYDNAGVIGEYTISGSGTVVAMTNSPVFTTPTLGAAIASSINKVVITAPAASATLTIANGKTLTASNSLTFTGTDVTSFAFPATSGTVVTLNAANTFSAVNTVSLNSGTLQAAQLGTVFRLANADSVVTRLEIDSYGVGSSVTTVCANGTAATPTALTAGMACSSMTMFGHDGTVFSTGPATSFRNVANQNWAVGAHGAYSEIAVTPNGSTALATTIRFEASGGITIPPTVTGGDKGAGSINFAGTLWTNGTQGLASKTCTINTANAATGITLTITNGIITATTTC